MDEIKIFEIAVIATITSIATGIVSSVATVKSLQVHIDYLRSNAERQEKAIERAHDRLDNIASE